MKRILLAAFLLCAFGTDARAEEVIKCKDFGLEVEMTLEDSGCDGSFCSGTAIFREGGAEATKSLKHGNFGAAVLGGGGTLLINIEGLATEYSRHSEEWYLPDGRWTNNCTRFVN